MLQIDGTFLIAALSFILFTLLMYLILYRPMVKIIGEREDFYNKNNSVLSEAKEKTQVIVQDNEEKITSSQKEASELIKNVSEAAKHKKAELLKEKSHTCDCEITDVQEKLLKQSQNAKKELQNELSNFVQGIVTRVLGKSVGQIELNTQQMEELLNRNAGGRKHV